MTFSANTNRGSKLSMYLTLSGKMADLLPAYGSTEECDGTALIQY